MDFESFRASLALLEPGPGLDLALQALWWDGKGDWERAHEGAQAGEGDPRADWVHAYLHRKEGDAANAGYWYRRAGRPAAEGGLDEEWRVIVASLLASSGGDDGQN